MEVVQPQNLQELKWDSPGLFFFFFQNFPFKLSRFFSSRNIRCISLSLRNIFQSSSSQTHLDFQLAVSFISFLLPGSFEFSTLNSLLWMNDINALSLSVTLNLLIAKSHYSLTFDLLIDVFINLPPLTSDTLLMSFL